MTENNEQWLLQGECKLCKRKNYCRTTCKARKNNINLGLTKAFRTGLKRRMGNDETETLLNVVVTGMELM